MTEVYEYQRGAILVGNEDVIYFRYYQRHHMMSCIIHVMPMFCNTDVKCYVMYCRWDVKLYVM